MAVGPHASTTPRTTLRKLGADAVVLGECEEVLPLLAGDWERRALAVLPPRRARFASTAGRMPRASRTCRRWRGRRKRSRRHRHHHHRFDAPPAGPGAEVEASRGCPYHCTFCAKDNFRDDYRRRPLETVLEEIDGLIAAGVDYVYFIDEIFLPNRPLLEALVARRRLKFGMQTRIDLWSPEMLELPGRAGCVSIEAGVESITEEGRALLDKNCRLSTDELADRLIFARRHVPFVQANLLGMEQDDPEAVEAWREHLPAHGVWANKPVPLFPYPGSPEYTRRWGDAGRSGVGTRATRLPARQLASFSDIQEQTPLPLVQLELAALMPWHRVLMTADTVGGVWTYAVELARALAGRGREDGAGDHGRRRSRRTSARSARGAGPRTLRERVPAGVDGRPVGGRGRGRATGCSNSSGALRPDVVHLNGYAHAALPWRAPVLVAGHSCVLSWWDAVKGEPAPARGTATAREVARGLRRRGHGGGAHARHAGVARRGTTARCAPARVIPNGRDPARFRAAEKEPLRFRRRPLLGRGQEPGRARCRGAASCPGRSTWPANRASRRRRGERPHVCSGRLARRRRWPDGWPAPPSTRCPARYEPFGLSALEAALSGCALVLGDIPSLREVWGDAACFVSPSGNGELAAVLRDLIAQPERRAGWPCGRAGGRSNTARSAWPEAYLSAYQSLADK